MPFKSAAQERYLRSQHPEIARRWTSEFGTFKGAHSQSFSPTERSPDSPGKRDASRDFGGRDRPLQKRAMGQGPVEYVQGSKGPLGKPGGVGGLRGRDVRAAAVAKVKR